MNKKFFICSLTCLVYSLGAKATTYTVTNLNDAGAGSLRAAITSANGNLGADIIIFGVAGTINLASDLPVITSAVDIQGQTATGATAGNPKIVIDCNGFKSIDITAGSSTVNTLCIIGATNDPGITLRLLGSNVVKGCYIGMTLAGNADGNKTGINIRASSNNTIGGTTAAERNIISGNDLTSSSDGIEIETLSLNTIIRGNYIGVKSDGTTVLGNGNNGVTIKGGSGGGTIGGTAAGAGNIIGGNAKRGIDIDDSGSITIQGNYIGTNAARANLGNDGANIFINGLSTGITVGSAGDIPVAGEANYIAYSKTDDGVHLNASTSDFNPIRGNIMFCNSGESIKLVTGSNGGIASPTSAGLPSSTNNVAVGTCATGNSVHVYRNSAPTLSCKCEGEVWIGRTTCAGGTWSLTHNLGLTSSEIDAVTAVQSDGFNNTSTYSSCNATIALPITLLYFKAQLLEGRSTAISWATSTESNTDYYEVLKSPDGFHWELMGTTASTGANSYYSLVDDDPLPGNNYYQLWEVERGGKKNSYAMDIVRMGERTRSFDVFPNPSSGLVSVNLSNEFPHYDLEIMNLSGQFIGSLHLLPGKNEVYIAKEPGIYFAKLKAKGGVLVEKVIVY